MKHLWEQKHPFYCAGGNIHEYLSWEEWLKEHYDADVDMNLIFRWDWEDPGVFRNSENYEPDWKGADMGLGLLTFQVMQQRRSSHKTYIIYGMKHEDEDSVREVLLKHWDKMCKIWSPLSIDLPKDPVLADLLEERGHGEAAQTIREHRR